MPEPFWKTFESELNYNIELGRANDITVTDSPNLPLPPLPPLLASPPLKNGYIVIKWNMKWNPDADAIPPNLLRLHLYKPKGPYTDPQFDADSIPNPPVGGTNEIIRSDDVGGRSPNLEDSALWRDYIVPYWEPVPGRHLAIVFPDDPVTLPDDRWEQIGETSVHSIKNLHVQPGQPFPVTPIPLRVATIIPKSCITKLLVLLVINRKKRLRFFPRLLKIEIKLPKSICFIATAAYGDPLSLELGVLRNWRDKSLGKSRLGQELVKTYYTFSPPIASIISRSENMRKVVRSFLDPLISTLRARNL